MTSGRYRGRWAPGAFVSIAAWAAAAWVQALILHDGVAQAQDADAALRRVLVDPADPEASFELARAAAEAGDLTSAIAALERLLILNPRLDNIKLELGVLYLETGATELGERLIREALENPEVPPDVRERAEEFLAAAEAANDPLRVAGSVTVGLLAESNANSAPSSVSELGFELDPEAQGQSDVSGFVQGDVRLRYDLGLQAGHELALDAAYYGQRYGDLSEIDFGRLSLSTGVDFNLTRALDRTAQLSVRLDGSVARRDDERFLTEIGPSATLRLVAGPRTSGQVGAFWRDQEFEPTTRVPVNDNRDGTVFGALARGDRVLSERASAFLGLSALRKTAQEEFEAYDEIAASAGYARSFDAPVAAGAPWILSLSGSLSRTEYEGPDPDILPDEAREDVTVTVAAGLTIPVADDFAILSEVGYTSQSSNYATNDFDNTFGSIALTYRF